MVYSYKSLGEAYCIYLDGTSACSKFLQSIVIYIPIYKASYVRRLDSLPAPL